MDRKRARGGLISIPGDRPSFPSTISAHPMTHVPSVNGMSGYAAPPPTMYPQVGYAGYQSKFTFYL